jgi:ABC-type Mn2+/Zn2+ transport system permease subunit
MHKSGSSFFASIHKKAFISQFVIGLLCSLFGAFLMFNGELLGDNTTGIARIVGIVGICLIATSSPIGIALKRNNSK